jgi:hypothetical protein
MSAVFWETWRFISVFTRDSLSVKKWINIYAFRIYGFSIILTTEIITRIIFIISINQLMFLTAKCGVFSAVRTEILNII